MIRAGGDAQLQASARWFNRFGRPLAAILIWRQARRLHICAKCEQYAHVVHCALFS